MEKEKLRKSLSCTLPTIKQITKKEETEWMVKGLPCDWEPDERPSTVLNKLKSEKETNHQECVDRLNESFDQINKDIEFRIRRESTFIKKSIESIEQEAYKILNEIAFNFRKSIPNGELEFSEKCMDEVLLLYYGACKKIDNLSDLLSCLEHERCKRFKEILREVYLKMLKIAHKLPYELEECFERDLMNINQITLNNFRVYNELCAKLKLKMENDKRMWFLEIEQKVDLYKQKYDEWLNKKSDEAKDDSVNVDDFALEIAKKIHEHDSEFQAAKKMIKTVVEKIFYGDSDDIQYLMFDFKGEPLRDLDTIYKEIYNSLQDNDYTCETLKIDFAMKQWEAIEQIIGEEVEACKKATIAGVHLWDHHFERVFELRDIFSMDLYDFMRKNLNAEDGQLIELNKSIDTLRMASTEDDLNLIMGECKKYLDSIGKTILKVFEKEKKFFDKYREHMKAEAEILTMEMQHFLKCQPNDFDVDPTIFRGRDSQIDETYFVNSKPKLMQQFDAEIKALHNWLYGMQLQLQETKNACTEILEQRVEKWIESQMPILVRELQIRQEFHGLLIHRLFHNVYRVRLAEILWHKTRLAEHEKGIKQELKQFHMSQMNCTYKMETLVKSHKKDIDTIEKRLDSAHNTHLVEMIQNQVKNSGTKFLDNIEKIRDDCTRAIVQRLSELQYVNVLYLKSIRLFFENGKYDVAELKQYKQSVTKINKDLRNIAQENLVVIETKYKLALMESQNLCEVLILRTEQISAQYAFNEYVKAEVRRIQEKLKGLTGELVEKGEFMVTAVDRLKFLADRRTGDITYMDEFTDNCEFIERILVELRSRLYQSGDFKLDVKLFRNATNERISISDGPQMKHHLYELASQFGEDGLHLNFNMILFKDTPVGNDYMAKIINLLHASLSNLQTWAKSYFFGDPGKRVEDAGSKLMDFMVNQMAKYLYYELQCEEIALQVSLKYVMSLDEFVEYVCDYYELSLNKFVETKLNDLKCKCQTYTTEMRKRKQHVEDLYAKIHNQLKPLHGYPKNRESLDRLCSQMENLEDHAILQQQEMDNLFLQFEQVMEENLGVFEQQIVKMEERLRTCVNRCSAMFANDAVLVEQIKKKLDYLLSLMSTTKILRGDSLDIHVEILEAFNNKINSLKRGLKMTSRTFSSTLKKDFLIVQQIHSRFSKMDDFSVDTASVISVNVYSLLENFKRAQEKCLNGIKNLKAILDMSRECNEFWKNDVKKVISLYTVDYPATEIKRD